MGHLKKNPKNIIYILAKFENNIITNAQQQQYIYIYVLLFMIFIIYLSTSKFKIVDL